MYLHEIVLNWYVPTRGSSQLICTLHEAVVNWYVHEAVVNLYVPTIDSSQLICTYIDSSQLICTNTRQ